MRLALFAIACLALLSFGCTKRAPDRSCEAISDCKRECEVGAVGSCTRFALAQIHGAGTPRDVKAGTALLERACVADDEAAACASLSGLYRSGIGVPRDKASAERLLDKAVRRYEAECTAGEADSCYSLFLMRKTGPGRLRDAAAADALQARTIERARAECAAHRPASCRLLAGSVEQLPGGGANSHESIVKLEEACDGGSAAGCRLRALQVYNGAEGSPRDQPRATRYFTRALDLLQKQCDGGMADRCVLLGAWIGTDDKFMTTPRDPAPAYVKACELGDAKGCAYAAPNVGRPFGNRPADPEKGDRYERRGLDLYAAACADGWAADCINLTLRLLVRIAGDRGIARDHVSYLEAYKRGIKLLEQDCENDDRNACRNLADDLSTEGKFGDKIHVNLAKAKHFYERACAIGGDASACDRAKSITPPSEQPEPNRNVEVPVGENGQPLPPASSSSAPPAPSSAPSSVPSPSSSR